ncbi:putative pinin-like protein ppn1 [Pseudohyphozyma bogoriensis]|nr:putative pinin-like protein ppn1 [Pseudohyphozyma bogoriensis]
MAGSDASDGESSDNESDDESNTSEEVVSPVEKREKVDCGKWEGKKKEMVSEIERRVKLEELDDDPNDLDDGLDAGVWFFRTITHGNAYDEQQLLRSYYAHESSPVQLLRRARFDPEVIVEMYRDDRWEAGRMLRDVVGLKAGVEEVLGRRVGALLREEGGRKRIKQEFEGGRSAK